MFSRQIQMGTEFIIFYFTSAVWEIVEKHSDIPQFKLAHVQLPAAFRPFKCEQNYLMDYN